MNSSNLDKHYYTPEISEFHVGFRYEYFEEFDGLPIKGDGWTTYILPTGGYFEHHACPFGYYKEGDLMTDFRVKCLDRRDIEELGWEHAVFDGVEEFNKPNARLNWVQETQRVIIAKWEVEWFDVVFNGTIKNFNELQKLMKQLLI